MFNVILTRFVAVDGVDVVLNKTNATYISNYICTRFFASVVYLACKSVTCVDGEKCV